MDQKSKLYGIGVGPGDPDLITVKALKIIREVDILAIPCSEKGRESMALNIVSSHFSNSQMAEKELLELVFPMTNNSSKLKEKYEQAAKQVTEYLREGKSVAFITIGDPGLYSTFQYLAKEVKECGGNIEIIPGIPAFCAAAASSGISLTEKGQKLTMMGTPESVEEISGWIEKTDTLVLMKAGQKIETIQKALAESKGKTKYTATVIDRCGLPEEKIQTIEDAAKSNKEHSYFTTVIIKREK